MNKLMCFLVDLFSSVKCVLKIMSGMMFVAALHGQTSITPATHEVGAGLVPYQVLVSSTTNWTASTASDWVTLSRTSGSADGNLMITAAANTTGVDRTASIIVGAATHVLTQRAASAALRDIHRCQPAL